MVKRMDGQKRTGIKTAISVVLIALLSAGCGSLSRTLPMLQAASYSQDRAGQSAMQSSDYYCPTCQAEPLIEYVDLEVAECIKQIKKMPYQPGCSGGSCGDYPVSVRAEGVGSQCKSQPTVEGVQVVKGQQ
ncbi:MAG: hypothetical protein HON68_04560 [Gammaproteobacteria bacterium]|nr:hypothetical protein [Gammaproteobacteria bacterium]MBT3489710.1 hypothetical protein [Gammaproteobacteria bacterium]MBT3719671.1 hypothetical protein [Gammaproteobacteria bacterium]MBT3845445.1 hypothetical protein [Gammaproteobacteria bacterium]MBT3892848.1 hypothetical protein [Gammaproteobacteria bacterium]